MTLPSAHHSTHPSIVGIGVSVWDTVLLVDRYPKIGAVVKSLQQSDNVGGGVAVALATASRLGSSTALVDSLGDDFTSQCIVNSLNEEGVLTSQVSRNAGMTGSRASIWTETHSAERTIVFSPGTACDSLQWSDAIADLVSQSKLLHINGRHASVCTRAIEIARQAGTTISFDGGAHRYRDEIVPLLRHADIAIVAREFAQQHFQRQTQNSVAVSAQELVEFLQQDLDCEIAGVTDGENGSYLVERCGACFHQPAIRVDEAVDTTGCGDTYHGAFMHAHVNGAILVESAELAAKVSAANAREMGALAFGPCEEWATNP